MELKFQFPVSSHFLAKENMSAQNALSDKFNDHRLYLNWKSKWITSWKRREVEIIISFNWVITIQYK